VRGKVEGITTDKLAALQADIARFRKAAFAALIEHYAANDERGRASADVRLRAAWAGEKRVLAQHDGLEALQAEAQAASDDLITWLKMISQARPAV
jgi:hypothetical protein